MGNRGLAIAGINLNPMTALAISNKNVPSGNIIDSVNTNVWESSYTRWCTNN